MLDDSSLLHFISSLGPKVIDLLDEYTAELSRPEIYDRIAKRVITDASSAPSVALITHGHPLFLVSASESLIKRAELVGLSVSVVSGISSIDTLLTDLRLDFGYGFQAFDATTLVVENHPINTRIPLLVFQAANTLDLSPQFGSIPIGRITPLLNKLQEEYPPDHVISFVVSPMRSLDRPDIRWVKLANAGDPGVIDLWRRPTIYVPPI